MAGLGHFVKLHIKENYVSVKKLVINLDNGPSAISYRTQFIKRITEFAEKNKIEIRLAYYPPYHSKYNPVERCWRILDSVEKTLELIKEMTWKGIKPIVHFFDKVFEKGIKMTKKK